MEGQKAQVELQGYETAAAYLTLVGNVAIVTIAEAAYVEQIGATKTIADTERDQVHILATPADAGTVPYSSVLLLETQLSATEAEIPPLEQKLAQTRHLLAILLGEEPGASTLGTVALTSLELPSDLPLTLPSILVRQRPDILAAEARLHEASAAIGVATAALFPHITLTGSYGWEATSTAGLFSGSNVVWQAGAQLAAPVFHGGELWFKRKAALDAYEESLAAYRETVLSGLAQVADQLRALEHGATQVQAQSRQESSAREALRLTSVNYQSGVVNYLDVLAADAQLNQAVISRIEGRAQRLQDTVALFVALGGGWSEAEERVLRASR